MNNDDTYGSTIREHMKKSMSQPFQSLNRRKPHSDKWAWVTLAIIAMTIAIPVAHTIYLATHR
jgi:hypothetical protein